MQAPCNRAILSADLVDTREADRIRRAMRFLCFLCVLLVAFSSSRADTVTGLVQQIDINLPNTKLTFSPTNVVLLSSPGLQIGGPKTISTTNGGFAVQLDAGDYWVGTPLINWRKAFHITVRGDGGTYNITNLCPELFAAPGSILWEESSVVQGSILIDP